MKANKGSVWINLGLLLVAAALFLAAYNLRESRQAQQTAADVMEKMCENLPTAPDTVAETESPALPEYLRDPNREMPVQTIDGRDYIGVLSIPALELELPILSQWSYPNFKVAPCRYQGSAYNGSLVIAAHNYASHFGNLKSLQVGESVLFTDMEGTVFSYEVVALETLMPMEVEEMVSGDWDLTLFTCTLGGQSRVTVRCARVESQ